MEGASHLWVTVLASGHPIGTLLLAGDTDPLPAAVLAEAISKELVWELHRERMRAELVRPLPVRRPPRSTVMVCSKDRPDHLRLCLASISRLEHPVDEVLIVDNGLDPETTGALAKEFGARYVHEPLPGLDRARNRGVAEASGDVLLCTDDDVEVHPSWATALPVLRRSPGHGCRWARAARSSRHAGPMALRTACELRSRLRSQSARRRCPTAVGRRIDGGGSVDGAAHRLRTSDRRLPRGAGRGHADRERRRHVHVLPGAPRRVPDRVRAFSACAAQPPVDGRCAGAGVRWIRHRRLVVGDPRPRAGSRSGDCGEGHRMGDRLLGPQGGRLVDPSHRSVAAPGVHRRSARCARVTGRISHRAEDRRRPHAGVCGDAEEAAPCRPRRSGSRQARCGSAGAAHDRLAGTFSVVVPSRGTAGSLAPMLHELRGQDYPEECLEVLVVVDREDRDFRRTRPTQHDAPFG